MLADLNLRELKRLLGDVPFPRMTANTITEMPQLVKELEKVRKHGFAVDDEEAFLGIRCVAAPLKNRNGKVIAAISATVPAQRMGEHRTGEICRMVTETARLISEQNFKS
jgi:DNA-binding IclR family transcriptional regulator